MSPSGFLLGMFTAWVVIGLVSAVVMGRRGYHSFSWMILGVVFGPLVVPLALARGHQAKSLTGVAGDGVRQGPVDVLVGVDGSDESLAAATVVANMLGERIGRLTLTTVVDYDTAVGGERGPVARAVRLDLAHAADAVKAGIGRDVDTVVLAGVPADVLPAHAVDAGYDVLAVGSRGRGATKRVMGSVATRLSRGAPVPVLVVTGDASRDRHRRAVKV